jgi:serine/threonine protein kinase/Tol biopolymer transport system component
VTLTPGSRLGSYEIVSLLGAGGMGEVYRATDTVLKRQVALKVLPSDVAANPERVSRFQREAEVLAALNHPNIAHLYGIEQSNSTLALAMELVEGETLADRIAKGPIALDEALLIAKQIAEALEAAHEQGIIHRDLKPANIKVRDDGTVKVLDFGLAKALEPPARSGSDALTNSPTITSPALMTGVGMMLGTAAYMSPEQAKGRPADKRSDLWSFGCVVYEMLTGCRAFDGGDVVDVLASVVKSEPDWDRLPPNVPAAAQRLLRRCLEKDRRERTDSAASARLDLDDALRSAEIPIDSRPPRRRAHAARWLIAGGCGLAFLASVNMQWAQPSTTPAADPVRFSVSVPADALLASSGNQDASVAVSPDGRALVVGLTQRGVKQLWVRQTDRLESRVLDGTEGASWPFWSPDSQSIAFTSGGQIRVVSREGGPVRTIADTGGGNGRGGTWSERGGILFATTDGRILRVLPGGGDPVVVQAPAADHKELLMMWPEFLPDGTHFLFSAIAPGKLSKRLFVGSLDGSTPVFVRNVDSNASFANGFLLFTAGNGRLQAQRFDPTRLTTIGDAVIIVEDFARATLTLTHSHFSVSRNGLLAYQPASLVQSEIVVVDRRGMQLHSVVDDGATYVDPALSPDGRYVAVDRFDRRTGDAKVWLFDLQRSSAVPVSPELTDDAVPVWIRDGSAVLFSAPTSTSWGLYRKRIGTTARADLLHEWTGPLSYAQGVTSDGNSVLYMENLGTNFDLKSVDLVKRTVRTIQGGPRNETRGRLSPDGRWVAFVSDESGRQEVYVQSTGDDGIRTIVSSGGGQEPRWRDDGRELFYTNATTVFAVSVQPGITLKVGTPDRLFSNSRLGGWPAPTPNGHSFEAAADGQSFILVLRKEPSGQSPVSVLINWPSVLPK